MGALQRCDLFIAIGMRFDDRVTGQLDSFAPNAKVIHCDIDPAEIGKNREADLPIVGDARLMLIELGKLVDSSTMQDLTPWVSYLQNLQERYPTDAGDPSDDYLLPQEVIKRIGELSGPDTIFATGVGQHQMWAAHFLPHEQPHKWLTSGGAGTMGYCVPAAVATKLAHPDRQVVGIVGDGAVLMTGLELLTAATLNLGVVIFVFYDGKLGQISQFQKIPLNRST